MTADEDLQSREKPICPYCGEEQEDAWEICAAWELIADGDEHDDVECQRCNKPFRLILEVAYSYTTETIKKKEINYERKTNVDNI